MRIVGAEMAGLDPHGQMAAQEGHDLRNLANRSLDSLGDRRTSPFSLRTGPAVPTTESNGRSELFGNEVHLLLRTAGLFGIVDLFGLCQTSSEFLQRRFGTGQTD